MGLTTGKGGNRTKGQKHIECTLDLRRQESAFEMSALGKVRGGVERKLRAPADRGSCHPARPCLCAAHSPLYLALPPT